MPTIGSTPIKAAAQRRDLRKLLNTVVYTSIGEIGDGENISKSYVAGSCDSRFWPPTSWRRPSQGGLIRA
jgi:hypothetical protein